MKKRPKLSGLAFALTAFDPRYTLIAIPLFVMYNRKNLKEASLVAVGSIAVSNAALLYPGVGSGFLTMLLSTGLSTPPYYYTFIPIAVVIALLSPQPRGHHKIVQVVSQVLNPHFVRLASLCC